MQDTPKIVYDEGALKLIEIRKDAIDDQLDYFISMCENKNVDIRDIVDLMDEIRYLKNAKFTDEEPRLLSYEEISKAKVLLCWCEEICYDHVWAEEEDSDNSISDWIIPCFIVHQETFTEAGEGDIGKPEEYGKVEHQGHGDLFGQRFWSCGKRPTFEQMKSKKWEGLGGYEYE